MASRRAGRSNPKKQPIYPRTPPFQMSSQSQSQKNIQIIGDQYPHKHTVFHQLTVVNYSIFPEYGTVFDVQIDEDVEDLLECTLIKKVYNRKKEEVKELPFLELCTGSSWKSNQKLTEPEVQSVLDQIYYMETVHGNFWNRVDR